MKKRVLRMGLLLAVTAVFLVFFARSVEWGRVIRDISDVNVPLFLLLFPGAALHFFTRSLRWRYLLVHEKRDVRFRNMVEANILGFTVNSILPGRIGELVRPLYLARKEGLRKGFAIGTVVVERVFDMFTMCLFLGLFLLARPLFSDLFAVDPESYRRLTFWGLAGAALASGLLALILFLYFGREKALRGIAAVLKPVPERFRLKILTLLREFIEGLKFFHSAGNLAMYALLSAVLWLGIIWLYWILFLAYGVPVAYFLLVPYVFLTGVGASIPTPGMVGGFHYFSRLGMTSLHHIDPTLAVSMTLVAHAVQIAVTCALGYAILWREGLSLLELRKMGEIEKS